MRDDSRARRPPPGGPPRQPPDALALDARASACVRALGAAASVRNDDGHSVLRALDLAADAVILVDRDRRILYVNERATSLTGYASRELVGRRCLEGLQFQTCAERCTLFDDGEVCERRCTLRTKDGADLVVFKSARVLHDEQGEVVGGIESLQAAVGRRPKADILHLRVAPEPREDERLLRAFTHTLVGPVLTLDPEGRITSLTARAAELLGIASAGSVGRPLTEIAGDSSELHRSLALLSGRREEPLCCEVVLPDSGQAVLCELRALVDEGGRTLGTSVKLHPSETASQATRHGLIAESAPMRRLLVAVERLARIDATVLLTGASGVGKEAVALALHRAGPRAEHPFVAINCSALSESLLESELFGHERGAFTSAVDRKLGRLEVAEEGTVLLDEIGCLTPSAQVKLLRVLENRTFERVGGNRTLKLKARIIAATNSDLEAMVAEGSFREDLFYRLQVLPLEIPPLLERPADILPLARHFLKAECADPVPAISAAAACALRSHLWPGNVRELRNAITHALAFCSGATIELEHLPELIQQRAAVTGGRGATWEADTEAEAIRKALQQAHWVKGRAASILGISRTTLWRKMQRHGIR